MATALNHRLCLVTKLIGANELFHFGVTAKAAQSFLWTDAMKLQLKPMSHSAISAEPGRRSELRAIKSSKRRHGRVFRPGFSTLLDKLKKFCTQSPNTAWPANRLVSIRV